MPRKTINPNDFKPRPEIREMIEKAGLTVQELAVSLDPPQSPTTLYARLSGMQGLVPEMEKNLIEAIEKLSAEKETA